MKRARFILLFSLLGILMLAASAYVLRSREPVYQGRPLRDWLKDLPDWKTQDTGHLPVMAVRHIGSNAMPVLVTMLRARDSPLKLKLVELAKKQHWIKFDFTPAHIRRLQAINACDALGPSAGVAIPELVALLRDNDTPTAFAALRALGTIGTEALPLLSSELTNESRDIRLRAVAVVASFRSNSPALVPPLLQRLHDPNADVRNVATAALGRFRSESAVIVPALIERLEDSHVYVRVGAAQGLGSFEKKAQPAIPALLQALQDEDERVRVMAAWALKNIDLEAAKKAGVK